MKLLNEDAPLKTKFLRANHSKFVTKDALAFWTKLAKKV